jgi:hypothetical protein
MTRRRSGTNDVDARSSGKARGGGRALEAGEDGEEEEEEDGEEANTRRSLEGRGRPGWSGRKPPRFGGQQRWTDMAGGDDVGGSMDGGFREADGGGEFRGARTAGAAEGGSRGG